MYNFIMDTLDKIKSVCENCILCDLHKTRNNIVFSDGNKKANLFLIGEAPGENEDNEGKPFVGRAGKLLDKYLEEAGLSRAQDLYVANIIKCRPPKNRVPKTCEKDACRKYLYEQILAVNPKVVILCGTTALTEFVKDKKITEIHGKEIFIDIKGKIFKAVPILHPSPLCRIKDKQQVMVEDLKKIKQLVRG
ncbi:MAG: uracil-DNA glycosylase [bacterium]|nr:uracil-DNA glycosylase [bacterium]